MAEQIYIIARKQSLLDACIQVYGTSKLLFQFAKDNGLYIDSAVNIGDSLLYDDELGDQDLKNKIEGEGFIINNPVINFKEFFTQEYLAVYNAFITKPIESVAISQNEMVSLLIEAGIWSKLDVFYIFAGHTNTNNESLINWVNPGTFDATAVNSPSFVDFEGFTGDGITAYINSNYKQFIDSINFQATSGSFGLYSRVGAIENKYTCGSSQDFLALRFGVNTFSRINSGTQIFNPDPDGIGFFIASRIDSINSSHYKNKVGYTAPAASLTGIPRPDFTFCGRANVSSFSAKQLSVGFIGGGLTQQNANDMTDAIEAYMDSNGKGIIP